MVIEPSGVQFIMVTGLSGDQFSLWSGKWFGNRTSVKRESDLLITSMIADWIGQREVLLPTDQNDEVYKIRETNKPSI